MNWKRIQAGLYRAKCGDDTFEVEDVTADLGPRDKYPGERRRWIARRNGQPIDAGSTKAEAQHWCEVSAEAR